MSFEGNATAAEMGLARAFYKRSVSYGDYAARAWRAEVATRGIATKPPENKSESAERPRLDSLLADIIEEALKARTLGVSNCAIFWRMSERYEAVPKPAPPQPPHFMWLGVEDANAA